MVIPHFIFPFISYFSFLSTISNASINICGLGGHMFSLLLGVYLGLELLVTIYALLSEELQG